MKRKWILLGTLVCFAALMLCGCGGTPMEKAAKNLEKAAEGHDYTVTYVKDPESLEIDMGDDDDLDLIFETLNKEIEDQDVGNLYFRTHGSNPTLVILAEEKIGQLKCKSMQTLGLSKAFSEDGVGQWGPLVDKASLIYLGTLPKVSSFSQSENKDKILSLKRIWIGDANVENVDDYPALEELGICANVMPTDRLKNATVAGMSEEMDEDADNFGINNNSDNDSNGSDSSGEEAKKEGPSEDDIAKAMEKKEDLSFIGGYERMDQLQAPARAKALKHIIIAPSDLSYKIEEAGSSYIFLLQNYKGDLLVNPPQTKLDVDPAKGASDEDCVPVKSIKLPNLNKQTRWNIVSSFLRNDVKDCYNKGVKLKEKNKRPVINGRALVFKVDASAEPWKSKRKFYDYGQVLGADKLGTEIPLPEYKGDYQTFVYVYPTYDQFGVYTKGTKAYKQTWHCQVFDLKNGIAYKPEQIASKKAPKKMYYYGAPPKKKSGEVKESKIYNYLKKLKVKEAPKTNDAAAAGSTSDTASADSAVADNSSSAGAA